MLYIYKNEKVWNKYVLRIYVLFSYISPIFFHTELFHLIKIA